MRSTTPRRPEHNAHYTAALAFFATIIWVVGLNAIDAPKNEETGGRLKRSVTGLYRGIAILMVIFVGYGLLGWWQHWKHSLLQVEVALVVLFLVFWITQTKELWKPGLRPTPDSEEKVQTPQ